MRTSKQTDGRDTYDPFGKGPENGQNGGGTPNGQGFGYPGGNGQNDSYGQNGGYGSNENNGSGSGSFYGPDYFGGGYGFAPQGGFGYPGGAPQGGPARRNGYGYQPAGGAGYKQSQYARNFGIFALVFFWLPWISLLLGILALTFAVIGGSRDGKLGSSARMGMILGIIAIVLALAIIICSYVFQDEIMAFLKELQERTGGQTPDQNPGGGNTNQPASPGNRTQLTFGTRWRL